MILNRAERPRQKAFRLDEPVIDRLTCEASLVVENQWKLERISYIQSTYKWHKGISYVICVIAHVFLFTGIIYAVLEFKHANVARRRANKETELRLSLEGVAIKTSLNGLVLFAISLIFYFMYLYFIYPITIAK